MDFVKNGNDIDEVFASLPQTYPEIIMGFVLPEVVKKQQPTIPYSEMAQEALTVKKRKPKDKSAIQKKLKVSVERGQKQPWKDYTNIQ